MNGSAEEKHEETVEEEHDPHYAPIVYLPEVHVSMLEDEEDEMVKLWVSRIKERYILDKLSKTLGSCSASNSSL